MLNRLKPEKIKSNQRKIAIISLMGFVIVVSIFIFLSEDDKEPRFKIKTEDNKIDIIDPTAGAKAEDRWLAIAEQRLDEFAKYKESRESKTNRLEDKIQTIEANLKDVNKSDLEDLKKVLDAYEDEFKRLNNKIADLSNIKMQNLDKSNSRILPKSIDKNSVIDPFKVSGTGSAIDPSIMPANGIEEIKISLNGTKQDIKSYDLENYLPAGSYAPAVITSGVDASVGIASQADPRPVLFRITGKAVNASYQGEKQQTDLTGCIVTGAASGDLSSEKVFVRLLKMSCSKEKGKMIETNVEGYASALGKAGVRGNVISREGDLVVKSFFAGLAGGLGEGASQRFATPVVATSGLITEKPENEDVIGAGFGKGLATSGDRIAEYLIDRAEQYQPVITIPAGIDVELVFHKGVYLDGRIIKKEKSK